VLADTDVEGNETVNLQLQNVSAPATIGAQNTHVATITDDDADSNAPVTAIWKPTAAIFLSLWSMEIWPLPKVLR
jgi:hypothetical protein